MIEKIRIKKDMNISVNIGDVYQIKNQLYVIINVLNVATFFDNGKQRLVAECLGQKYRSENKASQYMSTNVEVTYGLDELDEISYVGEFIFDSAAKIWVQVTSIVSTVLAHEQLKIKYEVPPVIEWGNKDMEEAIFKYRKNHMRLL